MKRARHAANSPERIVIVQLGQIGDLMLVTPLFKALRRAKPNAELHLLAGRRNHVVALNHPDIDRVHTYTKRFWATVRLLLTLRSIRFDVWLDPKVHRSTESMIFAFFARARMKIGYRGSRVFTHPSLDALPGAAHYTQRTLRNLEYLGIFSSDTRPAARRTPDEDRVFARFCEERGIGDYIAVNISASHADRFWPVENWISLTRGSSIPGLPFVVSGQPADCEAVDAIVRESGRAHAYATGSISGTFPFVNNARLVVSVDTCVIHIAAAFNRPTVGLYVNLPDFFEQYLPLSDHCRALMHPDHGAAVDRIPVAAVSAAIESLLSEVAARTDRQP